MLSKLLPFHFLPRDMFSIDGKKNLTWKGVKFFDIPQEGKGEAKPVSKQFLFYVEMMSFFEHSHHVWGN